MKSIKGSNTGFNSFNIYCDEKKEDKYEIGSNGQCLVNGKVVAGKVAYNGNLYIDGNLSKNRHEYMGQLYEKGVKISSGECVHKDLLFIDGKLFTGRHRDKSYVNGSEVFGITSYKEDGVKFIIGRSKSGGKGDVRLESQPLTNEMLAALCQINIAQRKEENGKYHPFVNPSLHELSIHGQTLVVSGYGAGAPRLENVERLIGKMRDFGDENVDKNNPRIRGQNTLCCTLTNKEKDMPLRVAIGIDQGQIFGGKFVAFDYSKDSLHSNDNYQLPKDDSFRGKFTGDLENNKGCGNSEVIGVPKEIYDNVKNGYKMSDQEIAKAIDNSIHGYFVKDFQLGTAAMMNNESRMNDIFDMAEGYMAAKKPVYYKGTMYADGKDAVRAFALDLNVSCERLNNSNKVNPDFIKGMNLRMERLNEMLE